MVLGGNKKGWKKISIAMCISFVIWLASSIMLSPLVPSPGIAIIISAPQVYLDVTGLAVLFLLLGLLTYLHVNHNRYRDYKGSELLKRIFKARYLLLLLLLFIYINGQNQDVIDGTLRWIKATTAEKNIAEIRTIASEITANSASDLEKTQKLIHWFDQEKENFHNLYFSLDSTYSKFYPLLFMKEKPHVCLRVLGDENPEWTIASRCGACQEYAEAFNQLALASNLTSRVVANPNEDHVWNEVYLNGEWVVIDVSWVNENNSGIFYNPQEFRPQYNMSYIYAVYPNGSTEDITYRYRPTRTLSFVVTDPNNEPLQDAKVSVISYNLDISSESMVDLPCETDAEGKCSVTVGVGTYVAYVFDNATWTLLSSTVSINDDDAVYYLQTQSEDNFASPETPEAPWPWYMVSFDLTYIQGEVLNNFLIRLVLILTYWLGIVGLIECFVIMFRERMPASRTLRRKARQKKRK